VLFSVRPSDYCCTKRTPNVIRSVAAAASGTADGFIFFSVLQYTMAAVEQQRVVGLQAEKKCTADGCGAERGIDVNDRVLFLVVRRRNCAQVEMSGAEKRFSVAL